jgi:serine/threonine protein kinase
MKQMSGDFFNFEIGETLSGKYEVIRLLGKGWESEVYLVEEVFTGIHRAIKVFFPERNIKNRVLNEYAKKLHKLRDCPLLIQYLTQEKIRKGGEDVFYMVSDYVQSQTLNEFMKKQDKKQFTSFEALHILYDLTKGLEVIHSKNDYHGDLHTSNILINRKGLGFNIKLIDFHKQPGTKKELMRDDIVDLINIFFDILGGASKYSKHKPQIKSIIMGRKKSLILKKFPKVSDLRIYLENLQWNQ